MPEDGAERVPGRGARRPGPDGPALVAGLALALVGGVLLAGQAGAFDLSFAALAPLLCAAAGAILLARGLGRRD